MNNQNNFPNNKNSFNEFDIDPYRTSNDSTFAFDISGDTTIPDIDRSADVHFRSMGFDNGISNIPVDAVMHADPDLKNIQTRSVGIAPKPIGHHFDEQPKPYFDNYAFTQPPKLKSERGGGIAIAFPNKSAEKNINGQVQVPVKPFYVAKTNFLCFLSIVDIIAKVEKRLNSILEVSYQFMQNECMWDAVYLRGSSHCKFQIHVFKEDSKSFIIEGNRLSGDGFPFRRIYDDLKADILNNGSQCETRGEVFGMGFTSGVSIPSTEPLNDTEAAAAIKPIIDMAKSSMIDSQFEASAIICDLSGQEDMQQLLCEGGCVKVLTDLLCRDSEFQNCNYHAICALANLSSSVQCQELLATTPAFLTTLLRLAADGPYYSAEVRRESARILANICDRHSVKVLNSVDNGNIRSWMNGVDDIKDERLRTHASRAKLSLNACTTVY